MRVILGKGNDMEELIKRLERVIQTGAPDKDGMHPISAEAVLEVVKGLSEHSTTLAEVGTDCISRQQAIDALRTCYDTETITMDNGDEYINYGDAVGEIEQLPPIQPKRETATVSVGKSRGGVTMWYECAACGELVDQGDTFCSRCGRRLIHE